MKVIPRASRWYSSECAIRSNRPDLLRGNAQTVPTSGTSGLRRDSAMLQGWTSGDGDSRQLRRSSKIVFWRSNYYATYDLMASNTSEVNEFRRSKTDA